MKRLSARSLLLAILFVFVFLFLKLIVSPALAQVKIYPGNAQVTVGARVGEFYLNLSGYASPYASVVLTVDGNFIRSTVADQNGIFYFTAVGVSRGFDHFCLTQVDFRRIGDSEGCLTITPITQDTTINDIFLPPTIGILRKQIGTDEEGVIYGYSMPNATITIKIKDGKTITVTTDATGYYSYRVGGLAAGKYFFTADAQLGEKKSLPPTKSVELDVLSRAQQLTITTAGFLQKIIDLLAKTGIGYILLILILLVIIIALLLILRPGWTKLLADKLKRHPKMHHEYLLHLKW